MAKFGKFVGQSFELITNDERSAFENVLESVFNSLGDIKLFDIDNELGDISFVINLKEPIKKVLDKVHRLNYAYDISTLFLQCWKHKGRLETSIGQYTGEPFIQYSITAWTNGKYHEYRKHHKNDRKFRSKEHYMYDTEILDFTRDLQNWRDNVLNGIAY